MKKRKTALAIACILFVSTALFAAGNDTLNKYSNSIGAQFGRLSGIGLSYQKRISDLDAVQTTAYISYDGDSSWSLLEYVVGLEYQHTIYSDFYSDWFVGQLYVFGAINHSGCVEPINYNTSDLGFTPAFGIGGGVGVEMILIDHFSMPIEFGYGAYWDSEGSSFLEQLEFGFVGQVGVRYRY
jgi:hypothetical protein